MFRWLVVASLLLMSTELLSQNVPISDAPLRNAAEPSPAPGLPGPDFPGLRAVLVAEGLAPVTDLTGLPDGGLLVAEKAGRVVVVDGGDLLEEPFIDVTRWVESLGNEQGLLTVELHPEFEANGRAFLFFTDLQADSRLVAVTTYANDRRRADAGSAMPILEVPQEHQYHQSGSIAFGPDGYLWLTVGDGGGIGDPEGNGQDPLNLYATVLRLDVDGARPYAVPSDNPFVADGSRGRPEVWAYGVRNPWRISIDAMSGYVYIPDVGQEGSEEVNVVPIADGGRNLGWSVTEGSSCYGAGDCDTEGQTMPVYEYLHEGDGCAIVGGGVYRGEALPELAGHYFYGDYCVGWVRSFAYHDGQLLIHHDWRQDLEGLGNITTFGTDSAGEMYVGNLQGQVWRIERAQG